MKTMMEEAVIFFRLKTDIYLQFCIRNINLSPTDSGNCWDTITASPSFESTNMTFPTTGLLYTGADVNNPLTFNSNNAWPVREDYLHNENVFSVSIIIVSSNCLIKFMLRSYYSYLQYCRDHSNY